MNKKQLFFTGITTLFFATLYAQACEQPLDIKITQDKGEKSYHDWLEKFKRVELIGGTQKQFKKIIRQQIMLERFEQRYPCNMLLIRDTQKQHQKKIQSLMRSLRNIKFPKNLPVNNPDDYDNNIEKTFKFVAYMQALQRATNFNFPLHSKELTNKYHQLIKKPLQTLSTHIQTFNGDPDPITLPTQHQKEPQNIQDIKKQHKMESSTDLQLNILSSRLMNKLGLNKNKKQIHLDTILRKRRHLANECIREKAQNFN